MGTFTTKLVLFKPAGGDNILRVDDLNANWDIIDAAFGVTKCTSTTRPSTNLYDGRLIYETDTNALVIYILSTTSWKYATISACTDDAAVAALVNPYNGQMAVSISTGTVWQRFSGAWRDLFAAKLEDRAHVTLAAKVITQSGAYLTTSGGTELKLPKLSLTGVTCKSTTTLKFVVNAKLHGGTSGDVYEFRVRQTSDTGSVIAAWRYEASIFGTNRYFEWPISLGALTNELFFLSIARITGTGTQEVTADGATSFAIYSVGSSSSWVTVP